MTNCLFYTMFFTLFLNLSFGSLRYSQINRNFMSIYKGMLEACLITVNTSGEPIFPYFDKTQINDYVVNYLDKNISRYSRDYEVKTTYLVKNLDTMICSNKCTVLKISLKARINAFLDYEKDQTFVVRSEEEL